MLSLTRPSRRQGCVQGERAWRQKGGGGKGGRGGGGTDCCGGGGGEAGGGGAAAAAKEEQIKMAAASGSGSAMLMAGICGICGDAPKEELIDIPKGALTPGMEKFLKQQQDGKVSKPEASKTGEGPLQRHTVAGLAALFMAQLCAGCRPGEEVVERSDAEYAQLAELIPTTLKLVAEPPAASAGSVAGGRLVGLGSHPSDEAGPRTGGYDWSACTRYRGA